MPEYSVYLRSNIANRVDEICTYSTMLYTEIVHSGMETLTPHQSVIAMTLQPTFMPVCFTRVMLGLLTDLLVTSGISLMAAK